MKISIYALHLGFGGVEKYVITLANMLADAHDVEIISTYKMQDKPAFYVRPEVKIQYLIEELKPNREELRSALKKKNPLLIIREGWRSLKVLYLKRHRNIVSLKHCQSDVIISTRIFHNTLIGKYARPDIVKITGEHNHHNNDQKYIDSVISSCRGFDYFIPISKELCEYYCKEMKNIGVETMYIRFCIDENPNKKKPAFEEKNLISVGRFSHEKGMIDLVNLFRRLHSEDRSIQLNIVGDGEEYRAVTDLISKDNLQDCVVLHGFRDKQYIYRLMQDMSLYIMTSYTESFGIVLLEAMSCGIPCIAYSSAQGAHEIIKNGYNGWLIDNRDEEKMMKKVLEVLSDPQQLRELSENAFATAEEFSYDNTKRAWLALMENISRKRENIR